MNTGAIITAVGTVLTAVATVLVGWFVKRTDRAAKMTQANMEDQQYILKLVGALREDYWVLADWAFFARSRIKQLLAGLAGAGIYEDDVPVIPTPIHRALEGKHARGEPVDTE